MAAETLKVGRDKVETPVTEVDEDSLRWYANECRNGKLQAIAKREIARRTGGAPAAAASAQAQPSQALARQQQTSALAIEGHFRDPSKATLALKAAAEAFHLIAPAPMVGALPEGCAMTLAVLHISPDDPNLYRVGDKFALDKTHLASIGNVMGASVIYSRRTDDGSHAHYCSWTAKVRFRQFDGTMLERPGSVEQDLREPNGAEYIDAVSKAEEKGRDPTKQIRELRRFITRHAESKAINRAYAACGIRRSYTKAELQKPFCVARVVFTGQSDDPVARKQFREGIMKSFLGSSDDAFGPSESSHVEQLQEFHGSPETIDAEGEEYPPEPRQAQAAAAAATSAQPAATTPAATPAKEDDRGVDPEKY